MKYSCELCGQVNEQKTPYTDRDAFCSNCGQEHGWTESVAIFLTPKQRGILLAANMAAKEKKDDFRIIKAS